MSHYSLRHLSDDAVTRELAESTTADRRSIAAHVARIAEYDRRELYLPAGCKSMFRYCVGRLRLSEDTALQRIRVGRVALRHPGVFDALADGRLSVSAVQLVASRARREDAAELLAAIDRKTIKQVRRLLAERYGRVERPIARPGAAAAKEPRALGAALDSELVVSKRPNLTTAEPASPHAESEEGPNAAEPGARGSAAHRARLTPVGPGVFELVALLGSEACDQLEACRDLLGHAVPSGDLAEVLERAIALQLAQLRGRRCGATDRSRAAAPKRDSAAGAAAATRPANPRRIRNAVRRAVWERDGRQCAYVSTDGHRCEERGQLELDHVVPVARGGQATVGNLRLLCSAHNRHVAEREFGRALVQGRIEAARRRRAEERLRKAAERERAESRRAAMARQDEELGTALRNLGYRGEALRRALVHCAERADAPPEARLRHALGCMAPNARRELPVAPAEAGAGPEVARAALPG